MGNRWLKFVVFLGIVLLIVGCAPSPAPAPTPAVPAPAPAAPAPVPAVAAKPAWEAEWENTVEAAKKEGKLFLYSAANPTVRAAISTAFKQKHGIQLESITARGIEMATKLLAERRAGLYLVDLFMAGTTDHIVTLKPAGALDPLEPALILPEVVDRKAWYGGDLRWVDSQHTVLGFLAFPNVLIVVNTELVKPGEIRSLRDLLNPKWRGKILMNDPTVSGAGYKSFTVIGWEILNLDYWRDFARQEPVLMRDQRLLVEWVARGKYPIVFAARSGELAEFKRAGAPLDRIRPEEGTYVSMGIAAISLVNRAPHPNAAKVFLNWLLSKEGQIVFTRAHGAPSARLDVPTEGLEPLLLREPGEKYFLGADSEEWLLKEAERIKVAKEIFGHLVK